MPFVCIQYPGKPVLEARGRNGFMKMSGIELWNYTPGNEGPQVSLSPITSKGNRTDACMLPIPMNRVREVAAALVRMADDHARAALALYMPPRPDGFVHEPGCQKVRIGEEHCCTCEDNAERRRQGIKASAIANAVEVLDGLGGLEQHVWRRHREEASRQNPKPEGWKD